MEEGEKPRTFKRKRPPSKEATRLMVFALLSSVGLAAVLGYVFLPTLLHWEQQPKDPHYELAVIREGSLSRVVVVGSSFPRELGYFEIHLAVDGENLTFGPLQNGMEGTVSFLDANDNGILDREDYFLVEVETGKTYTFLIVPIEKSKEGGVGYITWEA